MLQERSYEDFDWLRLWIDIRRSTVVNVLVQRAEERRRSTTAIADYQVQCPVEARWRAARPLANVSSRCVAPATPPDSFFCRISATR